MKRVTMRRNNKIEKNRDTAKEVLKREQYLNGMLRTRHLIPSVLTKTRLICSCYQQGFQEEKRNQIMRVCH